jgi:hypothetical protein
MFQSLLNLINSVPAATWDILVETLASAVLVSPVMVAIKKWFSVDGEKKMMFLVILGSMLASAGLYLREVPELAPWVVVVQGWLIFATTQPVYFLFVKPLIRSIKKRFAAAIAKATALNEVKSAAVPPQGLPVTSAAPVFDDFSH